LLKILVLVLKVEALLRFSLVDRSKNDKYYEKVQVG